MPESPAHLGELISVHRPSTLRLWLLALMTLGPLALIAVALLVMFNDLSQGREFSFAPLGCAGPTALLLALLVGLLVRDFRKWLPTRTVSLNIHERGLSYRDKDRFQVCGWHEIKDVMHRTLVIHSKHSAPRKVSVIRSIVKNDGTVISLAETLNLQKITGLIEARRRSNGGR